MQNFAETYDRFPTISFVEDLSEVNRGVSDLVESLECMYTAVTSRSNDPDAYMAGSLAVALQAARKIYSRSSLLCDEGERLLREG